MDFDDFSTFGSPSSSPGSGCKPSDGFDDFNGFGPSKGGEAVSGSGFSNAFDPFDGNGKPAGHGSEKKGIYWPLTLLALALTAIVSFLVAFLMPRGRGSLLMGVTFMAPVATVLSTALLLESLASPMNPRYSRKAQYVVALLATITVFIIGCFGELTTSVIMMPEKETNRFIFVMDKSGSMSGISDIESTRAVSALLDQMDDATEVGLVLFWDVLGGTVDAAPLTANHRAELNAMLNVPPTGGTDFYLPLSAALHMISDATIPTRILMVTDGEADISLYTNELISLFKSQNAVLSCVKINGSIKSDLTGIIDGTGGRAVEATNASELITGITELGTIEIEPTDILDVKPEDTGKAMISALLFLLAGLVLGIALSLMLSRQGQKRFQLILSPLMGIFAFLLCIPLRDVLGLDSLLREGIAFTLYGLVIMRRNA